MIYFKLQLTLVAYVFIAKLVYFTLIIRFVHL